MGELAGGGEGKEQQRNQLTAGQSADYDEEQYI